MGRRGAVDGGARTAAARAAAQIVARYAQAYRNVLERPERSILVVCHSLPVSYALLGREGNEPSMRVPLVPYATPYPFTADELLDVVEVLERWLAAPSW